MKQHATERTEMTKRGFHSLSNEEAPTNVTEIFEWYEQNLKMVPNLVRIMANAPALLRSYWQTQLHLRQFGNLSSSENNVVQMAIARENACHYCVAGHYLAGKIFFGTPDEVMNEIKAGTGLSDAKLDALRTFALRVYATQGRVVDQDLNAFLDAGYTRAQALDVVANIAAKVMSNFTNQLAGTELDESIRPFATGLNF